ncbi:hypothetical protein JCM10450v2_002616 [Rhodotorula kratochvilovae]
MAAPPLGVTYVAPALELPAWLSYLSIPTATILAPYTIATLLPNGVPTLLTGAVEVTQYETALLQLPLTVDSAADVRGQNLGNLYTTAGGTGAATVLNDKLDKGVGGIIRRSVSVLRDPRQSSISWRRRIFGVCANCNSAVRSRFCRSFGACLGSAAADNASSSRTLTPSQLAAAIAAPICFFFAVLAVLILCCCCLRRRRRRRADRRISEEDGLLDGPAAASAAALPPKEHARGVLWEWVPHRRASDGRSRVSRASGRSALSRFTGGLLGRSAGRSGASAAGSTPRSSPRDGPEKGFVGVEEKAALGASGASREYGPPGEADVGDGVGPTTPLLGAEPPSPTSPPRSPRSPLRLLRDGGEHAGVRYAAFPSAPALAPAFEDVDLTSPRFDTGEGGFDYGPPVMEETGARSASLPVLPPISPTNGPLHLSTLYDPYFAPQLPPSPSSYEPPSTTIAAPPPVTARASNRYSAAESATARLSELWRGYETSSPQTDAGTSTLGGGHGDKRDSSRPGYLSWLAGFSAEPSADEHAQRGPQEVTPPQTPEMPGLRAIPEHDDDDSVGESSAPNRGLGVSGSGWVSGMGMWAGRRGSRDSRSLSIHRSDEVERMRSDEDQGVVGERRGSEATSGSSELNEMRLPDSSLFLNDARWTGSRRSSPPPFSSFEPISTSSISYDPPIFLHGPPDPTNYAANHLPRHSASFTTDSLSRYDDASSPAQSALPLDSPLVYTPPRFSVVYPAGGRAARQQRSVESGLSVLDRIAASFGNVKEGLTAGLGVDFGEGGMGRRSGERQREISTESMTDPFQYSFPSLQPRLPALPSPANTPPRHRRSFLSLHRRSSQSLRRAHSQPQLFPGFSAGDVPPIPEMSPTSVHSGAKDGARDEQRWTDPFEEDEARAGAHPYAGEEYDEEELPEGGQRWASVPDLTHFQRVEEA